ncbi:MAG: HD domain-containing protein [Candidatus Baltobacteraceae bacterium]
MSQTEIGLARVIAQVAHGAIGQTRADHVTPYFTHPARVAELTRAWGVGLPYADQAVAAAYLHDVVEDTKVTSRDLIDAGVSSGVVDIVELLTKSAGDPDLLEYYEGITQCDAALLVKCADRCANLEDALGEVLSKRDSARWAKYAGKTRTDVLPMYALLPRLQHHLEERLQLLEEALAGD